MQPKMQPTKRSSQATPTPATPKKSRTRKNIRRFFCDHPRAAVVHTTSCYIEKRKVTIQFLRHNRQYYWKPTEAILKHVGYKDQGQLYKTYPFAPQKVLVVIPLPGKKPAPNSLVHYCRVIPTERISTLNLGEPVKQLLREELATYIANHSKKASPQRLLPAATEPQPTLAPPSTQSPVPLSLEERLQARVRSMNGNPIMEALGWKGQLARANSLPGSQKIATLLALAALAAEDPE